MTAKRYSDGKLAKWYYSQENVIYDGSNEYYLTSKESIMNSMLLGTNDLLDELNRLSDENMQLKKEINHWKEENSKLKKMVAEYNAPNCRKCIEYSSDHVGDYCMSENGLLDGAWDMFPCGWDYSNAKECNEYHDAR